MRKWTVAGFFTLPALTFLAWTFSGQVISKIAFGAIMMLALFGGALLLSRNVKGLGEIVAPPREYPEEAPAETRWFAFLKGYVFAVAFAAVPMLLGFVAFFPG